MRDKSHPEAVSKAFRVAVGEINRDLYGPKFCTTRDLGVGWVLGHERHRSGEPHGHAIIFALEPIEDFLSRREHWSRWYRDHGVNRLECVRSSRDVAAYATKYCLKEGNIEFSANLAAFTRLVH
jgi:hypothetical protein